MVTQNPEGHADALDPGQLPQLRALPADGGDPRHVDVRQIEHVGAAHESPSGPAGPM